MESSRRGISGSSARHDGVDAEPSTSAGMTSAPTTASGRSVTMPRTSAATSFSVPGCRFGGITAMPPACQIPSNPTANGHASSATSAQRVDGGPSSRRARPAT